MYIKVTGGEKQAEGTNFIAVVKTGENAVEAMGHVVECNEVELFLIMKSLHKILGDITSQLLDSYGYIEET